MKLIIATEEQKRQRDRLTHAAWGQRLDVEAFSRRELRLRSHPWAREAMATWLLADEDGTVLSSCETFRMESRWRSGAPAQGHTYGIASVYTEPAARGRGHAAAMLRLLGETLPQRDPLAHGALLFSEVGATLYERAGYVASRCFDRLIPAEASAAVEAEAIWLREDQLAAGLAAIPAPADPFLVWPTAQQLDWHLERERIYAELMGRRRPGSAGASIGGGQILWAADFKNETLAILLAHAPGPAAAKTLLQAAAHEAARTGLSQVRLWEEPAFPLEAGFGERVPRDDDALPMLASFMGVQPDDWLTIPRALWV